MPESNTLTTWLPSHPYYAAGSVINAGYITAYVDADNAEGVDGMDGDDVEPEQAVGGARAERVAVDSRLGADDAGRRVHHEAGRSRAPQEPADSTASVSMPINNY